MRLKPLLFTVAAVVLIGFGIVAWIDWHTPPLRESTDYEVAYLIGTKPEADAQLYRPLGFHARYYVRLPRAAAQYRWIAVDFAEEEAALPHSHETRPDGTLRLRRGDPLGTRLTDPALGEKWQVEINSLEARFASPSLTVHLTRHQHTHSGHHDKPSKKAVADDAE